MDILSNPVFLLIVAFLSAGGFAMALRLFYLIASESEVRLGYTRRMHRNRFWNVIFGHFMGGDGAYHRGFTSKKGEKKVTLQSVNNP